MQPSILKTDGGPHTPEQWGMATAMSMFPIDPAVVDERLIAAQKLQVAVAEVLVTHHAAVQSAERAKLAEHGDAHLETELGNEVEVSAAVSSVVAAAKGTPWEAHMLDPAVQDSMRSVLDGHFKTNQQIERQWHIARKGA